jgi:hypothetical protein
VSEKEKRGEGKGREGKGRKKKGNKKAKDHYKKIKSTSNL